MPRQIPRSPKESPDFDPSWRSIIVEDAMSEFKKTKILEIEDEDPRVVNYYLFLATDGRTVMDNRMRAPIRYALDAFRSVRDGGSGWGSKIKAMVVAQFSAGEIAEKLGTDTENIQMYEDLFFDIRAYLHLPFIITNQIFPFSVGREDRWIQRERIMMAAAFMRGREGVESAITREVNMSSENMNELSTFGRMLLIQRANDFLMARSVASLPSANDYDRYVAFNQADANANKDDEGESKFQSMASSLVNTIQDAARELYDDGHPVLVSLGISSKRASKTIELKPDAGFQLGRNILRPKFKKGRRQSFTDPLKFHN